MGAMDGSNGYRAVIFDVDNSLYARETGLFAAIDRRIHLFLRERYSCGDEEADARRRAFRERHHITLLGLMREEGMEPTEYLRFVHDVPVEELLAPDPFLGRLLADIHCPKHLFTNGTVEYARRVTRALGVEGHFTGVYDVVFTGWLPKPEVEAFRKVLGAVGEEAGRVIYVDDLEQNVVAAASLGMTAIHLHSHGVIAGVPSHTVGSLNELDPLLKRLLAQDSRPRSASE
jgi:putative hydrolase of the HAD superfamily